MTPTTPPASSKVGLTLSRSERAALDAAARRAFVTPSTFARAVLLEHLNAEVPPSRVKVSA